MSLANQLPDKPVYPVSNIAALNNLSNKLKDGDLVQTAGYYSPGDGGGNKYYWSEGSSLSPNSGYVVSGTNGRFIAVDQSPVINVAQWGAMSTVSDNSNSLNSIRDYCVNKDHNQHWELHFNSGIYDYTNNRWTVGLRDFKIKGNKSKLRCNSSDSFAGDYWPLGPREGLFRGNGKDFITGSSLIVHAGDRFNGCSKGDNIITLSSAGDAAGYASGDGVFLHGYCMQSVGYSPNLRYFEWATVTGVDGADLQLDRAIKYDYDNDWPDYLYLSARTVGSLTLPDQNFGKPRVLTLNGTPQSDGTTYYYPRRIEIEGITFLKNPNSSSTNRCVVSANTVIWRDVTWEDIDDVALDERESEYVLWENCKFVRGKEIDKLCDTVIIRGGQSKNNAENSQSINQGSSVNRLIIEGVDCDGKISASARDGTYVRNCSVGSTYNSNAATQGPFMPGDPSEFASALFQADGCTLTKLSEQSVVGTNALLWSATTSGTNPSTSGLTVTYNSGNDVPAIFRRVYPGRIAWLSTNSLVRGRAVTVKDLDGSSAEIVFNGALGANIASTGVTGSLTLNGPNAEKIIINGELIDLQEAQSPHPGLIKWEEFAAESPWTLSGTTMAGNGGSTGNTAEWPNILTVGKTYTLTYNMHRTGGVVLVRNNGSATNLANLSTSVTGATVSFEALGKNLEFRPSSFVGTITPVSLKES